MGPFVLEPTAGAKQQQQAGTKQQVAEKSIPEAGKGSGYAGRKPDEDFKQSNAVGGAAQYDKPQYALIVA